MLIPKSLSKSFTGYLRKEKRARCQRHLALLVSLFSLWSFGGLGKTGRIRSGQDLVEDRQSDFSVSDAASLDCDVDQLQNAIGFFGSQFEFDHVGMCFIV